MSLGQEEQQKFIHDSNISYYSIKHLKRMFPRICIDRKDRGSTHYSEQDTINMYEKILLPLEQILERPNLDVEYRIAAGDILKSVRDRIKLYIEDGVKKKDAYDQAFNDVMKKYNIDLKQEISKDIQSRER